MTAKRTLASPKIEENNEDDQEQLGEQLPVVDQSPAVEKRVLSSVDILDSDDIEIEEVPVPEWGGKGAVLFIRTMNGFERDKFEDSVQGKNGGTNLTNIRAKMVAASAVDADGNRIFSDTDVNKLGKKNAKALDRCFTVARRLSGFSEEDIDELAKNS